MSVRVYTDGAVSPNGHGGWAAIMFVDGAAIDGRYGGAKSATNNTMELQGIIEGMKLLPLVEMRRCANCGVVPSNHFDSQPIYACLDNGPIMRPVYPEAVIVSDSKYCVNGASQWVHGWQANGWKTASKQPVKNRELWEEVIALTKKTGARFEWVKGHGTDPCNILADQWAVEGKMGMYKSPATISYDKAIPKIGD